MTQIQLKQVFVVLDEFPEVLQNLFFLLIKTFFFFDQFCMLLLKVLQFNLFKEWLDFNWLFIGFFILIDLIL